MKAHNPSKPAGTRKSGWLAACAVLGLAAGFAARQPAARESGSPASPLRHAGVDSPRAAAGQQAPPAASNRARLTSAETVDSLLAIRNPQDLYARLALWQLDAPVTDLAAFWDEYRRLDKAQRDSEVIDLLFSQWTRTDPAGAVAAAKGSGHEGIPWWAWAINDPDAAVAAARNASKEMAGFVMRAIGQFHPEIARQVLEENPGFGEWNGIEGIIRGLARTDPLAALDFQRTHDQIWDTKAIEALARDDPHLALEWLRKQLRGGNSPTEDAFLRTLRRENPEMLAELAASLPAGGMKRKFEKQAFDYMVETNPEEALKQARAATSPRIQAERLAMVGAKLADQDPQAALAVFSELFKTCPNAANRIVWVQTPHGSSGSGSPIDGLQPFIDRLVATDPIAALTAATDAVATPHSNGGSADPSALVAGSWAQQDTNGFTRWLDAQPPGPATDRSIGVASDTFARQERFEDAISWGMRISEENQRWYNIERSFSRWIYSDRQAALKWLDQADLPDKTLQSIRASMPPSE